MRLEELLRTRATSMSDVIAMMQAIDAALPDSDGLKWFNRLYLRVTLAVRETVTGNEVGDPAFVEALDIAFANLYFDAIEDGAASVPSSWKALLESRHDHRLVRLQFALAGMNAHINRDLPLGLVQVLEALGSDPRFDDARRRDFDALNALLERVQGQVKSEFTTGLIGVLDVMAGDLDDLSATWKVSAARTAAWINAEVIWTLRATPSLQGRFLDRLDGLTALAGRGLLKPLRLTQHVRA